MITTINIDATKLDNNFRREKMSQVAAEMHTVINSSIFRDRVLKMKPFDGERSSYKVLSNMEIYKMIMHGAEIDAPQIDYEMDIFVDDYYTFKKVIGYTQRGVKTIFVNTKYFDFRHTMLIGSNVLHEYGHKIGFSHDFFNNSERSSSICYQLNRAYEDTYKKLFNLQTAHVRKCYRPWKFLKLRKVYGWTEVLV